MYISHKAVLFFLMATLQGLIFAQTANPTQKTAPKQQAAPLKQKPVPVSGQIFVVTKGGQNIKLALVAVSVYLASDVNKQVIAIEERDRGLRTNAQQEMTRTETELSEAMSQEQEAKAKQESLQNINLQNITSKDNKFFSDWARSVQEWRVKQNMVLPKRLEASRANREFYKLVGIRYYIENLTSPIETTKTDADGLFEISVPPGRYILTALSRRQVAGDVEMYEWAVEVDVRGANKKIMLSNDNLWAAKCDECLRLPIMQ